MSVGLLLRWVGWLLEGRKVRDLTGEMGFFGVFLGLTGDFCFYGIRVGVEAVMKPF